MICRVTLEFIILFQYNFLNKVSWRLKFCLFYLTQNLFPWIVSPKQFHKLPNCLQSKTQFLWPNWLRLIVRRNFSSPQVVKLLSLRGLQARYMANQRPQKSRGQNSWVKVLCIKYLLRRKSSTRKFKHCMFSLFTSIKLPAHNLNFHRLPFKIFSTLKV